MGVRIRESSSVAGHNVRRAELHLEEFNKRIDQQGYAVTWSRSSLCPCRDPNQEDHSRLVCSMCDNAGILYYSPTNIRAIVSGISVDMRYQAEGVYVPGSATFTVRSEYKLNFWDKLELTSSRLRFSEIIPVSGGAVRTLKYKVLSIDHLVSNNGTVYSDATVNTDGTITLPTVTGDFLSVSYYYRPSYIVLDVNHQIRDARTTVKSVDTQTEFPTQAVARLDFLVREDGA